MMQPNAVYTPDRSLKGKIRRRVVRFQHRRPARLALERPMLSITFDDAPASAFTRGRAVLEAHGLRGVYYIAASLAGEMGPVERFGNEDDIRDAAKAGHEIACHTFGHLDCGQAGQAEIAADIARNEAALEAWGLPKATSFAYPYGDVSLTAKRALAPRYDVLRALHHGLIANGADLNQAPSVGVEGPDGERVARVWLERAHARKAWLVLYTHDVGDTPSIWGCTAEGLDRLITEAQRRGFDIVTIAEGARRLIR